jgi:F420-dependent oxidoreductase-like protein
MLIGLHTMIYDHDGGAAAIGPRLREVVERCEAAGVHSIWPMDHFFQIPPTRRPPSAPMLEVYAQLAWMAAFTTRLEFGAMVTGVHHRHPGVHLKTVTTVDVLSGGRVWLGLGAGWNELESAALGIPMPPLRERFEQLEETLQLAHRMFDGDSSPYDGKHFRLGEPVNSPPPVRSPPILVGGGGERKTLRLVAQYADACNLFDAREPGHLRHKLDVLARHCDDVGRDFDEIVITTTGRVTDTPPETSDMLHRLADAGVDLAIVTLGALTSDAVLDRLPAVVAEAATLGRPAPAVLRRAAGDDG